MSPLLKSVLLVGLILVIGLIAIGYAKTRSQAQIGAGYVAHQVCSCIFVAQRSQEGCLPDLLPSMGAIRSEIVEVAGRPGVRAWLPFFPERTALYTPKLGCALQ